MNWHVGAHWRTLLLFFIEGNINILDNLMIQCTEQTKAS